MLGCEVQKKTTCSLQLKSDYLTHGFMRSLWGQEMAQAPCTYAYQVLSSIFRTHDEGRAPTAKIPLTCAGRKTLAHP